MQVGLIEWARSDNGGSAHSLGGGQLKYAENVPHEKKQSAARTKCPARVFLFNTVLLIQHCVSSADGFCCKKNGVIAHTC